MMQAGVCLRQDTETALPELTEQHRIILKEEELSGLESVYMAESETRCAAPGLNTLERECVTAHSRVSDVHHTHTSLIKTETDLGSSHTEDLIKTECLDSTELGYVTHLRPDQIKTETDDGGYLKADHISVLQDIKSVDMKSDKMKCESSEILVSDLMNTVMNGAGVDQKDHTEPQQYAEEPNTIFKKEESHDLPTQCGNFNIHCNVSNENNQTRIILKSANSRKKHIHCGRMKVIMAPLIKSSKNQSLLNFFQNETIYGIKGKIHTDEKPYRCTQCEKCFGSKSYLNAHLRIHTGEKPYKCTQCGNCFSAKSYLNAHLRIHSGEKPYKCTQCEKCFRTNSDLNKHVRVHTGEKPFKCTECGKCFSQKSNLSSHHRNHTGEKPYKCPQCEKCFRTKFDLITHQRIHSGEKPFICSQCGKCFSQMPHLNSHQRRHAGEMPCECPQCGKLFSTIFYLNIHLKVHTAE